MAEISVAHQIKRLLRHSAIYGIGHIVTRSIGFLLLPLYTNTIPAEEYGKAALLFSFLAIMNVIYGYGMDVAFLRYVALQDDLKKQKVLFSTGILSLLASSSVLSGFLILFSRPVADLFFHSAVDTHLLLLCSGILFFDALSLMPFMALRAKEKSLSFTIFKLLNVLVNIAGNFLFILKFRWGIAGIFWANLFSSGITFLLLMPIVTRLFTWKFDKSVLQALLRFGLPYIPSGLAVVAMDLLDRFFLERMVGLKATGIYSAGYKLGMFMALFVAAFRFAWHPFFLSTAKQPNAKRVFSRILTYFVLACSSVFLVISIFIKEIVRFRLFGITLFGEGYWESTVIVPHILISYIFYGIYVNFLVGIYLEKKTSWLPGITITAALVNIIANLSLIPLLGMLGSAYATILSYATMAFLLYFRVRSVYPIAYEWTRVVKIALSALSIFLLQQFAFQAETILTKVALLLTFPVALVLLRFPDQTEKDRLVALFRGKHYVAR